MKNFDERRAEIFRRSEQRIQARRRTTRHILLCIPLLLCLSAAILLLPQQRLLPDGEDSLTTSEILVEVQQENHAFYRKSTDTNQIVTLSSALHDAIIIDFEDGFTEEAATDTENTLNADEQPQTLQTYATRIESNGVEYGCYIITFTTREGNTVTYRLGNNTLTAMATNSTVTLSDKTAATLRALVEQLS